MKICAEKFHDECGVAGIYKKDGKDAAKFIYYCLYALQHRGQESTGITTSKGGVMTTEKGMGLIHEVFANGDVAKLKGPVGIGHVRYTTAGDSHIRNAQPFEVYHKGVQIAMAHNGNLVNARALRDQLEDEGLVFDTGSDTEVMLYLFARNIRLGAVESIREMCKVIKGSYAAVITFEDKLIGIRDVNALRPLCIGENDRSYVLASESCALDAIGAKFVRDVEPGEIVIIDRGGLQSYSMDLETDKKVCIFEYVYFARPDSTIDGISVYESRYKAGTIMAKELPVDADVVIGVPDSGMPAAIGYSEASGIPYGMGLIKNKYIGRTFIQPSQRMREEGVAIKLNPLRQVLENKRVVVVDDSIVRGTTSQQLVSIIRSGGAKEVHLLCASPPIISGCYFGVDTPSKEKLIAAEHSLEEIKQITGADSVGYISLEGLLRSVGGDGDWFCKGCFGGRYPMEIPEELILMRKRK